MKEPLLHTQCPRLERARARSAWDGAWARLVKLAIA
jgi:hypothetical protein